MKIKNKRMLLGGLLFILLGLGIAAVRFFLFTQAVHGRLKAFLVVGACILIGIVHLALSFQGDSGETETEGEGEP